jgi:hypothetical protein
MPPADVLCKFQQVIDVSKLGIDAAKAIATHDAQREQLVITPPSLPGWPVLPVLFFRLELETPSKEFQE